jgi:hypothetical protein
MRSEKSDHQNAIQVLNQRNQPIIVGFDIKNHTTTLKNARFRMRPLYVQMEMRIPFYGIYTAVLLVSPDALCEYGTPETGTKLAKPLRAVMNLNLDLYAMKNQAADAPRLQRTVVSLQRRTG